MLHNYMHINLILDINSSILNWFMVKLLGIIPSSFFYPYFLIQF